ncbi:hypothetical protein [Phenylobacterium sp.]|jgi:hypothetical protein|uniref:hypothetical protein n=1 Tax=Phenylobacterium sp. TaxID=1871053 RepID=UPI001219CF29|nr:hypothetical protein [Phenylobacterium sp.]THD51245.1 MAG: hypothetical protein E8A12_21425 [Phenylobacterium sp.]
MFWRLIKGLFGRGKVASNSVEAAAAKKAETTAHIDALMALPIRERPSVTLVGDEGVSGYNPPPRPRKDEP